jgi:NitT/TauT family transport system ATP-binding protein
MEPMATIEITNLTKVFNLPEGPMTALSNVSFELREKEFLSVIGPSGCGKSTILRLVAGLIKPTSGKISFHGRTPDEARRERLYAFVFQDAVMFPWRSVIKNVCLPLEVIEPQLRKKYEDRPEKLLELVGLKGFENARPDQLSGGMRQRAAIARALLLSPEVLLMDEPFGALDEITRGRMNLELLRIWKETEAAVLFITHSIEEAVFLSDRIVMLSPRPGTVAAVIDVNLPRPRTSEVKQGDEMFELTTEVRKHLAHATAAAMDVLDER